MNSIDPNRNTTCLITGSKDGIGKYTSQLFAERGFHVIVHGKDEHKIKHWVEQLIKTTTNQNIQGIRADLSDFEAIYKLYQWFENQKEIPGIFVFKLE